MSREGKNLLIFSTFVGVIVFVVTYSAVGEGLDHGTVSMVVGLLAGGASYLLAKAFLSRL